MISKVTCKQLVSVLIPLYNAEKYFVKCLDSILQQTYKYLEVIIVNDGSTDNSLLIAKEYSKKYQWIKVYSQKNSGASTARNKAFSLASGEYIQYLDADDCLHPEKISIQMGKIIDTEKNLISYGICQYMGGDRGTIFSQPSTIYQQYRNSCQLLYHMWINSEALPPLVFLIHRSLIDKIGGWNENLTNNDDGEFFARLMTQTNSILFVPNAISYYRVDSTNSLSKNISELSLLSLLKSISLYTTHVKRCNYDFTEALRVVYTVALIKLYPLNKEMADQVKKDMQSHNIIGYKYPKRVWLYDLFFFTIGIQRTAWLHMYGLKLFHVMKKYL